MRQFLEFFARHHASVAATQLRALGEWIDQAVTEENEIESAVATCFLEHMHQVRIDRVLAPYLSRAAKEKSRA